MSVDLTERKNRTSMTINDPLPFCHMTIDVIDHYKDKHFTVSRVLRFVEGSAEFRLWKAGLLAALTELILFDGVENKEFFLLFATFTELVLFWRIERKEFFFFSCSFWTTRRRRKRSWYRWFLGRNRRRALSCWSGLTNSLLALACGLMSCQVTPMIWCESSKEGADASHFRFYNEK